MCYITCYNFLETFQMISDQHKVKVRQVQNSNVKIINKWKDYFSIDDLRKLENKVLEVNNFQYFITQQFS